MRAALVLFAPALLVVACNAVFGIPARESALESADSDAGTSEAGSNANVISCLGRDAGATVTDGGLCSLIPTEKTKISIDGVATEYCDQVATVFDIHNGHLEPADAGTIPQVVRFFAVTTADGMAIHAHVTDPNVLVASPPNQGDSISVFVQSTAAGSDPLEVMVAPPGPNGEPLQGKASKNYQYDEDHAYAYAGRLVEGGYEVEMFIPNDAIGRVGINTSQSIHFDVAVNLRDRASSTGKEASLYFVQTGKASGTCPTAGAGGGGPDSGSSVGGGPGGNPDGGAVGGVTIGCNPQSWCTTKLGTP